MDELNPETGIYEMLRDHPALAALVGDRIYPAVAPAGTTTPYVVVLQVEEATQPSKDGPIPNGWVFQVACVDENNAGARAASAQAKRALNWQTKTTPQGHFRTMATDESNASWDQDQEYFQIIQEYRARSVKPTT